MGFGCPTDLAILGDVLSIESQVATVKPFHVFPNSTDPKDDEIKIQDPENELEVGKKYALALRDENGVYVATWEILELEGSSYQDSKLLRLKDGDDASLQWWINVNGDRPEVTFYGVDNKLFARVGGAESPFYQNIQVYPKRLPAEQLILIIVASLALGSAGGYFVARRKKK